MATPAGFKQWVAETEKVADAQGLETVGEKRLYMIDYDVNKKNERGK